MQRDCFLDGGFIVVVISFIIPGAPVPKGRPRSTKRGITYTPDKTRAHEDYVRKVASQYAPKELLKGALKMGLHFFFARPKSLPKKVKFHIKRPDCDNLEKLIMDSLEPRKRCKKNQDPLEGAIYENDSQIVSSTTTKEYGLPPRCIVRVEEWIGESPEIYNPEPMEWFIEK